MSKLDINQLTDDLWMPEEVKKEPDSSPILNSGEPELGHEEMEGVKELPPIIDAADFITQEFKHPPELVQGLFHQGTKMLIGGGSKAFKTWVQLDLAVSVANGVPWLGNNVIQGKVLYVNFEIHPFFFQGRIRVVHKAKGLGYVISKGRLDIWNLRGYAAPHGIIIPQIIERTKSSGYTLVVLDPAYKLYGDTDENSAGDVGLLMNNIERICSETGAGICMGTHYSKGNQAAKDSKDRISGSGVFAREPDSILPFTQHEEEGCFTVEPTLRNLKPFPPFVVRWDYPLMRIDENLDPANLKEALGRKKEYNVTKILLAIKENTAGNPISVKAWSEVAKIPRPTLIGYLSEFRSKGWIATAGEGQSARQYLTQKGSEFLASLP